MVHDSLRFLRVRRRSVTVKVRRPPVGTHVTTLTVVGDYVTTVERPYVVTGPRGDRWTVSERELTHDYSCAKCTAAVLADNDITVMTREYDSSYEWACLYAIEDGPFVVSNYDEGREQIGNSPEVEHGWGDIVVASDADGRPSDIHRKVVNGLAFFDMYEFV